MRDIPILFSAPMVRALLDGSKTQTRRVVKIDHGDATFLTYLKRPLYANNGPEVLRAVFARHTSTAGTQEVTSPCGQPGDQLWVKETIRRDPEPRFYTTDPVRSFYAADKARTKAEAWPWKRAQLNSIHCPRGLSRITLGVTDVRVERLQDISEADAIAEGTPCYVCGGTLDGLSEADCHCFHHKATPSDYRTLWESINGPGSWALNPWVWVVSFRRV